MDYRTIASAIGPDQLRAIEVAAHACGRLAATVESADGASSAFLLIRHAVLVHDEVTDFAVQLLRAREDAGVPADSIRYDRELTGHGNSLVSALEHAGFGQLLGGAVRVGLEAIAGEDADHASAILRAAIVAGAIVAPAPASRDAQRAAALAAALVLARGSVFPEPWVAPWQLDATARSAAVQVDRSASWGEWVRAWCHLLARDATGTERALRAAVAQLADERATAAVQHRVGGTDAEVLGWLQSHLTFTIRAASDSLGLTRPTVGTAIERLESFGYATELTGHRRDRVWVSTTLLGLAAAR